MAAALIGRRAELDAIEALLHGAREGRAGVVVVRGVAGVGKSALLAAFASAPDFRVLRADGVQGEAELAYAGLHQLLRPVMDLVARRPAVQRAALEAAFGLAPGAGDRFLVAAATLGLLADAADESPVLCVVDDLQWLDQASAAALVFAARRLDAERVALLLAVRSGEAEPPGLERFPSLELGGLERDDAAELLDGALTPADRRRILDAADGIPLALLELPRGPGASLGPLERSFAERIAALPEDTRAAVLVAAADDDPEGRTALRALGAGADALAPAEADGLLWASGDGLVFRHPLVRSAAYSSATFAERRRAHAALAAALPGDADADRRAWHRAAALESPDDSVADELEASAERARHRGGHAAAAAALERSARLTTADDLRARRLVGAAGASQLAGDAEHALRLAGEVLALPRDELIAAEAAGIRGAINAHRGASEDAEADLLRASRALAQRDRQRALRFSLAAGETAMLGGRYARASKIAEWSATLADADVADFVAGLAHLYAGRPGEAAPRFAAGRERAEALGDPQLMIWTGAGTFYAGDVPGARMMYARAVAAARERGAAGIVAFGLPLLAMFELIEGRFSQARADAGEGLRLAQECGERDAAVHNTAVLAWHAAVQGREDEARDLAAAALEWTVTNTVPLVASTAHRALAMLDLGLGRHEAAYERLAAGFSAPGAHPIIRLLAVGDLAEAAARCDRADEARPALAALGAWGDATNSKWAAAILAGADPAEGSLAAHAAISLPFDAARLKLRLGEKLRRERRRVDARQYLRAALDDFAALGAAPWERRAAEELRATGETARKRDASTLDDLTPQELQIARLVGEGASNRDIAGRLFLSPRTVEYHLRKVFQKLGVTSRTQLAALDW